MYKIKYLVFFCIFMILALGLASTGSAGEQTAGLEISASNYQNYLASGKETAMKPSPGGEKKDALKNDDDDEDEDEDEDEDKNEDDKDKDKDEHESVEEKVYGDGYKWDKINNDIIKDVEEQQKKDKEAYKETLKDLKEQYKQLKEQYEKNAKETEKTVEVLEEQIELYKELKDWKEARASLKELINLAPQNKSAYVKMNEVYKELGENNLKLFVYGKEPVFDVSPVVKDGRTLIPIRAVSEGMGASVNWDEATGTITIVKDGITVKLTIGDNTVNVNGQAKTLDVPALLQNSRTLVPLRFISEAFKSDVQWYPDSQMVVVN